MPLPEIEPRFLGRQTVVQSLSEVERRITAIDNASLALLNVVSRKVFIGTLKEEYTKRKSEAQYDMEAKLGQCLGVEMSLGDFERKIIRRLYGPIQEKFWRIHSSNEIYGLCKRIDE